MIEHVDLKKASGFGYASRESHIGVRSAAIARGVVVLCGVQIYVRRAGEALDISHFAEHI
jgi:hypothetical protein